MSRALLVLAGLCGLGPAVLAVIAAAQVARDPIRVMGCVALAAALNSVRPVGGGMVVAGTYRVRLLWCEWTMDGRRGLGTGLGAVFLLTVATTLGFFAAAPLVALAWRSVSLPLGDQAAAVLAVVFLLAVSLARHRPELPLRRWREGAARASDETLRAQVARLKRIAHRDGGVGHVGGIGAGTVGLHEALDAEELLREAARRGVDGARALHAPLLAFIGRAMLSEGAPAYPGGLPREELTVRARAALDVAR